MQHFNSVIHLKNQISNKIVTKKVIAEKKPDKNLSFNQNNKYEVYSDENLVKKSIITRIICKYNIRI